MAKKRAIVPTSLEEGNRSYHPHFKDSMAVFRMDIWFCLPVILLALLQAFCMNVPSSLPEILIVAQTSHWSKVHNGFHESSSILRMVWPWQGHRHPNRKPINLHSNGMRLYRSTQGPVNAGSFHRAKNRGASLTSDSISCSYMRCSCMYARYTFAGLYICAYMYMYMYM